MQIQGAPGGGTDFEVDLICIFNLRDLKSETTKGK